MTLIPRARHVDYTSTGTPLVRELPSDQCNDPGLLGIYYGLRHVDYTSIGTPVLAASLKCCDELNGCPKVEDTCFPGGISRILYVPVTDAGNCLSAYNQFVTFVYCLHDCQPDAASTSNAAGTVDWTNPDNALASDDAYATAQLTAGDETYYLIATGTCCSVPSTATITRVVVELEAHSSGGTIVDYEVKLVKGGTITGNNLATTTSLTGSDTTITIDADLTTWGVTLTPADVNAADFGVAVRYKNTGGSTETVSLDYVHTTVNVCGSPPTPPPGCTACDDPTPYHKWVGGLTLRGGSLSMEICCVLDVHGNPTFRLIYSGCNEGCTVDLFPNCNDPLVINFGNVTVNDCCQCNSSIETGDVNLIAVANCHKTVWARHVDYTSSGIPIVAKPNDCVWSPKPACGCTPHCGLTATITNVSNCSCLAGTHTLPLVSATAESTCTWTASGITGCAALADVSLTCTENFDVNGNPDGTVTLEVTVTCGASNTGTDSKVVNCADLEDFDETFNVTLFGPSPGSCGGCDYHWIDMSAEWVIDSNNCTGTCLCVDPLTLAPGTVDGETQTLDCVADASDECCVGEVTIRITR